MKNNLFGIQQEIRELEDKVNDVSTTIAAIYKEIGALRNSEVVLIDYKKINLLSARIKFENHPLSKLSNKRFCQAYVELLLRLVHLDKSIEPTINRLIFIQWIVKQAKLDLSLEELFVGALKRDVDNLTVVVESRSEAYYEYLIMDALLVANISGKASEDILHFVVDLCGFFDITQDKLRGFSIIAKSILQQDIDVINNSDLRNVTLLAKHFEYYFERDVLSRGISKQRKLVARIYGNSCYELRWFKSSGWYVDKGDVICTYRDFMKVNDNNKCTIKALCEGRLYVFKDKNVSYVVIHDDNDNLADVRNWALLRR